MVQKAKARRGRPPAYDAEAAMASVMNVFWHAGYAATSLDDISVATGMNRPSLYGAFGDKRALYRTALERYRAMARAGMKEALSTDRTLRDGIATVYKKALSLYFSGETAPRGCFMIGTAVTEAVGDPDLRKSLRDGLREIEAAFASRTRFAQKQGELAPEADAAALARLAAAILYSLAVQSRAGVSRAALEATAKVALDLICGPPAGAPRRGVRVAKSLSPRERVG
jgi:TetR/AcrR family transcriptional regulator, copper-responsive repressor